MKKNLLFIVALALTFSIFANTNLLNDSNINWGNRVRNGATGSVTINSDKTVSIKRTNNSGEVMFINENYLNINAGKKYQFSIELDGSTDSQELSVVVAACNSQGATINSFSKSAKIKANQITFLESDFIAPANTENLRFHIIPKTIGEFTVKSLSFGEAKTPTNLFKDTTINWGNRVRNGATGKVTLNSDKSFTIDRTNSDGEIMLLNENYLQLTPGKYYQVTLLAKAKISAPLTLMLQMPGSARRPFPTITETFEANEDNTLVLKFLAADDEKNLRIHLVSNVAINCQVYEIKLEEITKEQYEKKNPKKTLTSLECKGKDLARFFTGVESISCSYQDDALVSISRPYTGGLTTKSMEWDADKVKSIEVDFAAEKEPGSLYLYFESEFEGKSYKSYQTFNIAPDGEFHTIRFPVSTDVVWRGKITKLSLNWTSIYNSCTIKLKRISGKSYDNLIVNDGEFPKKNRQKIDLIFPRGNYKLTCKNGDNPGFKIVFLDRNYQEISETIFKKDQKEHLFTAPEMTVTAQIIALNQKNSTAIPVLEMVNLPPLDSENIGWKGAWIWSRNGQGPNDSTSYFTKDVYLENEVKEAFLVGSGDDKLDVIINGKKFAVNSNWDIPGRIDIASALKKGKNEIILQCYNAGAWGGVISDIYIKDITDKVYFYFTDDTWKCSEKPIKTTKEATTDVHVIGPVPAMPWGNRLSYHYVGPRGILNIKQANLNGFEAEIKAAPYVDTDKIDFKLEMPSGEIRYVQGMVTPATKNWKAGETIDVKFNFAALNDPKGGEAKVFFNSPILENRDLAGTLTVPKAMPQKLSSLKITGAGKRAWFNINGVKTPPIYYDLPANFITGPYQREHLIKNAVKSHNNIVRMAHNIYDIWKAPGVYDFSSLDNAMSVISMNGPELKVICVVATYMPKWWLKANPTEETKFFGNVPLSYNDDFQTIASELWITDLSKYFAALIDHIRNSAYADKIVGIAPVDGSTWEWMWSHGRGHSKRVYSGWSEADLQAYRKYLSDKYQTDEKLAQAWNKPELKIANALPPAPERIDNSSIGDMLDPLKDMDIIDWSIYRNEKMSDAIIAICKIIKENTNNQWLAGTYYGYIAMFSHMNYYLQDGGHMRSSKIARSPYVDFVYGPSAYHWRKVGGSAGYMQLPEAFSMHDKCVIVEQDIRNYTEPNYYEVQNGKTSTPEQSAGSMDRAFGMLLSKGMGLHYMEMYERWFREPLILDIIKSHHDLYSRLPETPVGTVPSEVCIVSDEDSAFMTKTNMSGIHVTLLAELLRDMPQNAFSYKNVLKRDLLQKDLVGAHKLYIITNLFKITNEERKALLQRFEEEKATVIWLYGAGMFDDNQGPSVEKMSDLFGLTFKMDTERKALSMTFNDKTLKNRKVTMGTFIAPFFMPLSGFDEVLAVDANNNPALVKWQKNGVTNYFSAMPKLTHEFVKKIAKESGVQVYFDTEDPVWSGNDFVVLHAKTSGIKKLNLPNNLIAESVFGVILKDFKNNEFEAVSGRTYGFLIKKR